MNSYYANKSEIDALAENIVRNEVLANLTSVVNRALESACTDGGIWADSGYILENAVNLFDEETEECKEVVQWFLITPNLAEELEEDGQVVLHTDDGDYWGRTGCGYALYMNFTEIAHRLLDKLNK